MSKGNIGVTSDNIFPVIKKFLYSDHEIFLRELISNAVDATQKLKTLSSVGEVKGDLGDLRVRVSIDKNKKTLTVSDHGIGMTDCVQRRRGVCQQIQRQDRSHHRPFRFGLLLGVHGK